MPRRFQRARKPEEKEVRRQAILKAARRLMREGNTSDISLNELARQSGVSKPNVYRYFESREEVLLHVLLEELRDLTERLQTAFASVPVGDVRATARAIVGAFSGQTRLLELMSIVSSTLERNMSADAIINAKQSFVTLTTQIAVLLQGRLPSVPLEECAWAGNTISIYIIGLWPAVNAGPAAAEVLSRPAFQAMKPDFDHDLLQLTEVLLSALTGRERKGGTSLVTCAI